MFIVGRADWKLRSCCVVVEREPNYRYLYGYILRYYDSAISTDSLLRRNALSRVLVPEAGGLAAQNVRRVSCAGAELAKRETRVLCGETSKGRFTRLKVAWGYAALYSSPSGLNRQPLNVDFLGPCPYLSIALALSIFALSDDFYIVLAFAQFIGSKN